MPRLAIDKDFLDDYSKLEKSVQSAVKAAIDKFAEHTYAGLHLEKLQKSVGRPHPHHPDRPVLARCRPCPRQR